MRKRKVQVEKRTTQTEREEIIDMIDEGLSCREIADTMNVNIMSVAGVKAWHKHPKAFANVGRK